MLFLIQIPAPIFTGNRDTVAVEDKKRAFYVKFPLRLHNRNYYYYYYFSAKFGVRRGQVGQKWHFLIEKLFLAFSGARVITLSIIRWRST